MSTERILYIVRHAKSSWDLEDVSDLDRPLKVRGIRDAYDMARRIKIERNMPELILSSPANRALHTATIFARVFELDFSNLAVEQGLYGNRVSKIREIVAGQDSQIKRLMLFGHNPDFSELASFLSGKSLVDMPTCGMCKIVYDAPDWSSIGVENVKDSELDYPKK